MGKLLLAKRRPKSNTERDASVNTIWTSGTINVAAELTIFLYGGREQRHAGTALLTEQTLVQDFQMSCTLHHQHSPAPFTVEMGKSVCK